MAKAAITIKFSDESREALERFTAALADVQERTAALLPTLCDDGQHVWTAEVCSLVEECAQCMTTRHKSGLDPEPEPDPCPCGCRRDVEPKPEPPSEDHAESGCYWSAGVTECSCGATFPIGGPEAAEHYGRKPNPEPESVTVTLPRDVVEGASYPLRTAARHARKFGYEATADSVDALADALDAASATQSERAL